MAGRKWKPFLVGKGMGVFNIDFFLYSMVNRILHFVQISNANHQSLSKKCGILGRQILLDCPFPKEYFGVIRFHLFPIT